MRTGLKILSQKKSINKTNLKIKSDKYCICRINTIRSKTFYFDFDFPKDVGHILKHEIEFIIKMQLTFIWE